MCRFEPESAFARLERNFFFLIIFYFSLKMSQEFREYANYDEYIRAHPEYEASFAAEEEVLEESFEDSSVSVSASLERFKHSREEMKEVIPVYGSFQECYGVFPSIDDLRVIFSIPREEIVWDPNEEVESDFYEIRENYIQAALGVATPELSLDLRVV